jgi:hypothetical protein
MLGPDHVQPDQALQPHGTDEGHRVDGHRQGPSEVVTEQPDGNGMIAISPRNSRLRTRTVWSARAMTPKMRWWASQSWPRITKLNR